MNEHEQRASTTPMAAHSAAGILEDPESDLPEHLARLPGGQWALWRWVGLRGAGFPAMLVLNLAAPACAASAERLMQAKAEARLAGDALMQGLRAALEACRCAQAHADAEAQDRLKHERRRIEHRAARRLKHLKLLDPPDAALVEESLVAAYRSAVDRLAAAQIDYHQTFDVATIQLSHALHDVVRDDRFREAIIWQNRHAFHQGVGPFLRRPPGTRRNGRQRLKEELIANYLQRYCVKNDSIGFFGPIGWARLAPRQEALSARPGSKLLATRTVYFDEWGINALARKLAENPAFLPWIAPRRLPFFDLAGTTLYLPTGATIRLTAGQAALLQACDGARPAKQIAGELVRTPANGLISEEAVYQLLKELHDRQLIEWTLEIPLELRPERTLQRLFEHIGEASLRRSALDALNELEAARTTVAQAAGDAGRLDQALGDLEATFTRLTGMASTRSAGKTYAGRTLVFEDCRRDIEVELGPALLEALGPPLSLLLQSARWITFQAAISYRQAFKALYTHLVRQTGTSAVDLVRFLQHAQPLLEVEDSPISTTIMPMFQERWARILDIPAGQRHVTYSSVALRPGVQAAFAAPAPGWRSAAYHSPDVLIAAPSAEAVRRGDYQLVMGELHVGINTLSTACFLAQHPVQEELFLSLERDLPGRHIVPVIPRSWDRMTSRTHPALVSPTDYRLVFAAGSPGVPPSHALPIGALVVEDTGSGLVARTRDGRLRFDLLEVFETLLSALAGNAFRLVHPNSHTPRVTIDRLVICREAWHCAAGEMAFARIEPEDERFLAARRWMRAHAMPRWVFVKVPVEEKPFYVDFDSPIYVNILAKMVRRTIENSPTDTRITITEMLPGPDQTWLPDAGGQHYTSELRFVAADWHLE